MREIKYRGPLKPQQKKSLMRYLAQHGTLLFSGKENVVFLDTSIFPSIGDFQTGFSRISLKQNGERVTVRIKEGNPSDIERRERHFSLVQKEVPEFLYFLHLLGLHHGFYRPSHRRIYQWGSVRLSIKTQSAIGDHFELELPDQTHFDLPDVQSLLAKFHLQCWTRTAYQEKIAHGMKDLPALALSDISFLN